jgi:hypothetical protein
VDVGDVDGRVEGGKSGLVLVGEKGQMETVEFLKEHGAEK